MAIKEKIEGFRNIFIILIYKYTMEKKTIIILIVLIIVIPILLLGVLAGIGAMAYFGVLSPATMLPERCELGSGFYCEEFFLDSNSDTIFLKIKNDRGKGIIVSEVSATNTEIDCAYSNDVKMLNGESRKFELTDCNLESTGNKKEKLDLEILWYAVNSSKVYTHQVNGLLLAKIE